MKNKFVISSLGGRKIDLIMTEDFDQAFEKLKEEVRELFEGRTYPSINIRIAEMPFNYEMYEVLTSEEIKNNIAAENKRLTLENYNLEHKLNIEKSKSKK